MAEPLKEFVITEHAAFELQRRGITRETVQQVLGAPEQRFEVRGRQRCSAGLLSVNRQEPTSCVSSSMSIANPPK
jgi:hypothetical protein